MTSEHASPAPDARTVRRAVAASAIGNATEWFDYGVYAVSVAYITHNFFPGPAGTLLALSTFAFSFLIRPLGGMVWGPLGDRFGRKRVLALTILLMAGATCAIGLLPTYSVLGIAAPILLTLLRAVQGFSTGGEYGGAATFMAEYAPDRRRGFFGSFLEFGTLAGFALGSLIVLLGETFIGTAAMNEWGWRVPFLLAAPLGLIGLYLRTRLAETPIFEELQAKGQAEESATTGLKDLVLKYWPSMLTLTGLVIALNVVNYTLLTYMPTYLETIAGLPSQMVLTIMFVAQFVMMLAIPFFGALSDRVGRKPLWYGSLIGLFVMAIPMFMLIGQGSWWALLAFGVLGLLYIPQLATISATFPAMFPAHVRYAGFAITYNVATSLFGGTAPLYNQAGIAAFGNPLFPAFTMMLACVVGLVAVRFMRETRGASLRGTGLPGADQPAARAPRGQLQHK
ncbi:MFS transporter [Sinomonas halotolerans]|uniref:MFS transporter n=1 Tax=Sinomonas halotolerans TaxID=1644133 RepID=A0ABU9WXB2_9MICC